MGNSVPVHCLPERAICLIESLCEDLYVSTCEFDDVMLRPNSRKTSSVLCVVWWKIARIHAGAASASSRPLLISKSETKRAMIVQYRRPHPLRDLPAPFFAPTKHHMVCCPDTGRCVGIISSAHCPVDDACGTLTFDLEVFRGCNHHRGLIAPSFRHQPALRIPPALHQPPAAVARHFFRAHWSFVSLAATETHLLGWCGDQGYDYDRGTLVAVALSERAPRQLLSTSSSAFYSKSTIFGAHFVGAAGAGGGLRDAVLPDSPLSAVVVFRRADMDFGVDVVDERSAHAIGSLLQRRPSSRPPPVVQSWGSALLRETSHRFVFVVMFEPETLAKICYLCRFVVSQDLKTMTVVRRWTNSSSLDLAAVEFSPLRKTMSLSEIYQPGDATATSLILIRTRNSLVRTVPPMICAWDRDTLEPLSPSIVCLPLPHHRHAHNFTSSTTRFEKDPSVSVVAAAVRLTKEKRVRERGGGGGGKG